MPDLTGLIILFQWIFVILVIILLFGIIASVPFIVVRLTEDIDYFLSRRKFIRDLTNALQRNLIENLDNVESLFLISFPRTREFPFVLNDELKYFIGLITSGNINFQETPPNEIRNWRTLIEGIINANQERLFYSDLPPEDKVAFKEIVDYFRDNNVEEQHMRFIRTRLLEIKQKMLRKDDDLRKSRFINYGAFFVSVVSVILTIVFGLNLISG
jgi:hypothetical protein